MADVFIIIGRKMGCQTEFHQFVKCPNLDKRVFMHNYISIFLEIQLTSHFNHLIVLP
jgi:hypothetical protein